jgi:hypothetical protein
MDRSERISSELFALSSNGLAGRVDGVFAKKILLPSVTGDRVVLQL